MKKTIYLVMMMIATMVAFNACSDDDDDDKGNGNGSKELEFVLGNKKYKLENDDDASYKVKATQLNADFANDDLEDLVTLSLYSYALNLDKFESSRLEAKKIELNKQYKTDEIGIGLRLALMAPDKHGVEGMGFDLSDNSIVTILEENASKNYLRIKFSNMIFENINPRTGEVLETLEAQGDFIVSITYKRLENID